MLTADTSSNGRGAAGRRALRLLAAAGAAAVAGAPGASAEGPWVKAKVKVSSEEICVPSGPAYAKLRDGTEIYVPKGGMLYIKKNDTEVETYIKKPDLPIPIPTGIMPALLGDSIAIVSEGSTTQLSFNLPGLTDGREDTEVVNLTGWVSFDTSGCGGGPVVTPVDHTGADQAVFHQTGVRPFPTPSPACNSIGLPSFDFHVDVPPMEFLGGLADTGHSTFTLEPTNAHVGQFSFSLDERGRIVGTGVMEHDLLWDSPNYRMMDGSEGGAPVRFREVSTVEFTLTIIQPGDLNEDGVVDGEDLARLLADWGSTVDDETPFLACDLNNDGVVNAVDMALLLSRWSTWF